MITGVTRGIGRGLALEFARQGHRVFGCGRSAEDIDEVTRVLGEPHQVMVVDVTVEEAVEAWAAAVMDAGGAPDLVINNAGLINAPGSLWEISAADFSDIIDVNVKGVVNVIRHLLPAMIERGEGVIVNMSSGWGRSTSPGVAPYCASKWAIEGLTQALAQELPGGLAVVAVSPGTVHTDMLEIAFGAGPASASPNPDAWSRKAVPELLQIGPRDSGRPLTIE